MEYLANPQSPGGLWRRGPAGAWGNPVRKVSAGGWPQRQSWPYYAQRDQQALLENIELLVFAAIESVFCEELGERLHECTPGRL